MADHAEYTARIERNQIRRTLREITGCVQSEHPLRIPDGVKFRLRRLRKSGEDDEGDDRCMKDAPLIMATLSHAT